MKAIRKILTEVVCDLPDIKSFSILKVWTLNQWKGINIAKGVRIGSGVRISGNIRVGENCSIGRNCILSSGNGTITIGKNTMLAPCVNVISFNHGIIKGKLKKEQDLIPFNIIIEDDVWIGINSTIIGNSSLKKGSVLGAQSLLIGPTTEYGIYVGSPAKLVKKI